MGKSTEERLAVVETHLPHIMDKLELIHSDVKQAKTNHGKRINALETRVAGIGGKLVVAAALVGSVVTGGIKLIADALYKSYS
jgi:hypothetical protein